MAANEEDSLKSRLDMEHGFMRSIIKNQVDRDEYDKEQRLQKVQSKLNNPTRRERPKRAAMQVYVPPHLRTKATSVEGEENSQQQENTQTSIERSTSGSSDTKDEATPVPQPTEVDSRGALQLKLEFVRQDGDVAELEVHEGEDLKKLVNVFGRKNNLDQRLRDALFHRLSTCMKGRAA